ncbi:hypothetical protein N1851_021768 [Merluccius polli]|uniref:Uncharacterized protein n=1 Tax=Merluccius polli TaxID=89951 RepID=A0AA47MJ34_MERPO|nr:hypothetical protein N1851_021768 [Merluccius polli]
MICVPFMGSHHSVTLRRWAETLRFTSIFTSDHFFLTSEAEAMTLVRDLTAVCQLRGFQLVKWISNSRSVLEKTTSLSREHWGYSGVNRHFQVQDGSPGKTTHKKGYLVCVCDRIGFLAPFILPAKLIPQNLWRLSYSWDDHILHNY